MTSSEGCVFRRKDGKWCAKWKDSHGKYRYIYRKTRAEAKSVLREALKDRDDNIAPPDGFSLNEALEGWLDGMRDSVSLRTWTNRESLVRIHIKPHSIGTKKLCKLTPEHLRSFYREKLVTLAPSTVGRLHDVIKKACNEQVHEYKRLRSNPASEVKPPKEKQRDMKVLKPEQVNRLLDAIRGSRYEVIIVLGAVCALRIGEALSLRYEDVDLIAGTISIRRTLWKGNTYPPKTPQSRRTLALPERALDALRRHCAAHGYPSEGYLCQTCNGTPLAAETFWRWGWKKALRDAELDVNLHYHDLRHGAASLLLNQSVPVPIVSQYLGHSNPSVTMKVYAHVISGTSGMAAAAMDAALG